MRAQSESQRMAERWRVAYFILDELEGYDCFPGTLGIEAVSADVWLKCDRVFPRSLERLALSVMAGLFLFVTLFLRVEVRIRESILE